MGASSFNSGHSDAVEAFADAYAASFEKAVLRLMIKEYIQKAGTDIKPLVDNIHRMIFAEIDEVYQNEFEEESEYQKALDLGIRRIRENLMLDI
ncbi:MAG TPA: hypothetical protein VHK91_03005 [Flavisolibacter sp.]|nr:hypothetical protein [Flavisolibacter sp.]